MATTEDMLPLLRPVDVAELLNVSRKTAYRLIERGELSAVRRDQRARPARGLGCLPGAWGTPMSGRRWLRRRLRAWRSRVLWMASAEGWGGDSGSASDIATVEGTRLPRLRDAGAA
jgi:hypothetical protein